MVSKNEKKFQDLALTTTPGKLPSVQIDSKPPVTTTKLQYTITSDKQVPLTLEKCREYIDLPVFTGEREITDGGVQKLLDEMNKRTFNPTNITLASAWLGKTRYKVNGQHTAWAYAMCDNPPEYVVREIIYTVNNREQLKLLYNTFDRGRGRTDTFSLKVLLSDTPTTANLLPSLVTRYAAGLRFWLYGESKELRRIGPDQLAALVQKQHAELFAKVGMWLQEEGRWRGEGMRRQAVVAALFATFDKVASKAPDFWGPVCDGLNLDSKDDPRWRLKEYLSRSQTKASTANRRKSGAEDVLIVGNEHIYRVCIAMWNKWRKGETQSTTPRPSTRRISPV